MLRLSLVGLMLLGKTRWMRVWELLFGRGRIEPLGFVTVGGNDGDFVGVVGGEVGVDEDEKVGDGTGE